MAALGTSMAPPGWEFFSEYAERTFLLGIVVAISSAAFLAASLVWGGYRTIRPTVWPSLSRWTRAVAGLLSRSRRQRATAGVLRSGRPTRSHSVLASPVEKIYQDLVAYWGPDRARTIVAEAAIERNKPDSPSSGGTSAAPHVVRERIRRAPDHPRREIELLEKREFAELREVADPRTDEEKAMALQVFVSVALELVGVLERCKARGEMRERDWEAITTLDGRVNEALTEVPLDRHRGYAEDLSKIRNMLERREHPGTGQNPFAIKDFRDRLAQEEAMTKKQTMFECGRCGHTCPVDEVAAPRGATMYLKCPECGHEESDEAYTRRRLVWRDSE